MCKAFRKQASTFPFLTFFTFWLLYRIFTEPFLEDSNEVEISARSDPQIPIRDPPRIRPQSHVDEDGFDLSCYLEELELTGVEMQISQGANGNPKFCFNLCKSTPGCKWFVFGDEIVQIASRYTCGDGIWLDQYSEDPRGCLTFVQEDERCDDTYFSWSTHDQNCFCVPPETDCENKQNLHPHSRISTWKAFRSSSKSDICSLKVFNTNKPKEWYHGTRRNRVYPMECTEEFFVTTTDCIRNSEGRYMKTWEKLRLPPSMKRQAEFTLAKPKCQAPYNRNYCVSLDCKTLYSIEMISTVDSRRDGMEGFNNFRETIYISFVMALVLRKRLVINLPGNIHDETRYFPTTIFGSSLSQHVDVCVGGGMPKHFEWKISSPTEHNNTFLRVASPEFDNLKKYQNIIWGLPWGIFFPVFGRDFFLRHQRIFGKMMSTFQFNSIILDAVRDFRNTYPNYFAMHQRLSDENYFYPYISCEKHGLLRNTRGHCVFDGERWTFAAELIFQPEILPIFVATDKPDMLESFKRKFPNTITFDDAFPVHSFSPIQQQCIEQMIAVHSKKFIGSTPSSFTENILLWRLYYYKDRVDVDEILDFGSLHTGRVRAVYEQPLVEGVSITHGIESNPDD